MKPAMIKSAVLDSLGRYRYSLTREWAPVLPRLGFVMLNPSTADAEIDDPTIGRCVGFAKAWGYGAIEVVNLFAMRATDPDELLHADFDPVGPRNDSAIIECRKRCECIVTAWGVRGIIDGRNNAVLDLLGDWPLHHLGLTKDGHPKHPLYLRGDTKPQLWHALGGAR